MTYILSLLVLVSACTFKKKPQSNQIAEGHEKLYSLPEAVDPKVPEGIRRIVLASTNDLRGHYGPVRVGFTDRHQKGEQHVGLGGADYLAGYFSILRGQYQNVLLVDSGDLLSPKRRDIQSTAEFYRALSYDAVTLGLGDFGVKRGQELAARSSVPVLLSNLHEVRSARTVEWTGTKPYVLKEIDGVKIGILGLVPEDVVELTPLDARVGLYVESMVQSTLRQARLLRSLGASMIVVLTHQGIDCVSPLSQATGLPAGKVNFDPTVAEACKPSGVLGNFLQRLPQGLVDVVVGGRHHQKMANFFNGTLLLSGFEDGKSFNLAEFYFDREGKLLSERTVVHQPVLTCHEFFKETNDCFTGDPSVDHRERVPARFLGREVAPVPEFRTKFGTYFKAERAPAPAPLPSLLEASGAQLVYALPELIESTQWLKVRVPGRELARILEQDFNLGHHHWHPVPWKKTAGQLRLNIGTEAFDTESEYELLAELGSLRSDLRLQRFIGLASSRSFDTGDEVSTSAAAPQRQ